MKGRMLFIFNPRSGKGQIRNKLMDIIDVFVKGGYEVVVHPTQGAKDAEKMAKIMAEEVDLIVCSGGDGTLDEVVTGHLFSVDVGSFNEDNFIYVAAFGMFTDVSYETSQDLKNILGHLAYVMEGAKRIFDVKTYHLCVEANGEVHEGDYIYGMITNSHSVGGFRNLVGNDVEMDDGLFEVTLIKKPKNPLELNEIIAALINAYDDTDMIDAFKADSLYIHGDEAISWTLDGEFGGEHKEVNIKNRKQALDIFINS